MALNIKDPETDRLARELAAATGETLTQAIQTAVRERHDKIRAGRDVEQLVAFMDSISAAAAATPVVDDRTTDEILGYDEHGLPR